MPKLLLSFSAVMVLLMLGSTALACDCVTLSPQKSFEQADVVFEGELTRSTQSGSELLYTFEVNQVLKGDGRREVTLVQSHSNCDPTFFPNTVYRVFAHRSEGKLFSGVCFGNEVLSTQKISQTPVGIQTTLPWRFWQSRTAVITGICLLTLLIIWLLARGLRPQNT